MSNKSDSKLTKKQHYIPQVYLRGFSPNYRCSDKDKEKYRIYRYDLSKADLSGKSIPVKSVCFEEYLYEVTGDDGTIVLPNYLEKLLSHVEEQYSKYRIKLESKAFEISNYRTNCFLTREEKIFWITYITTQFFRRPENIDMAEAFIKENWPVKVTDNQARNIAIEVCLPFFKEVKEGDKEAILFDNICRPLCTMSFGVGVDYEGRIITSDKAIYCYAGDFPCEEYEYVIFPISSNICLFMYGGCIKKNFRKNFLFQIEEEDREEIIKCISSSANNTIYASHELNDIDKGYIREVLEDKKEK